MERFFFASGLFLSLLLASAGPAGAQGPEPDTTDWRTYFPLEVGNAWQYLGQESVPPDGHLADILSGWRVEADTTVGGTDYFVLRSCWFELGTPVSCPDVTLVRYDLPDAMIVARNPDTGEDAWWYPIPCDLDAPFNAPQVDCRGPGTGGGAWYTYGYGYDQTVVVPPDTLRGMTVKGFSDGGISGYDLAAGLGFTAYESTELPFFRNLIYADVGGQEVGTSAFVFPTAAEPAPEADGADLALAVVPNPARGHATLAFRLPVPSEVAVALFDPLGRRVRVTAPRRLGAGAQRIALDLGALPPGVYVARLTTESGSAARKVTVR